MATTKPRINVTLELHRFELFKRLASLQGVSMSSLIAELLEAVAEPMERVCVLMEAAKEAPGSVKEGLRVAVARAESVLLPRAQETIDQFDLFMADVGQVVHEAGAPRPGGRSAGGRGVPASAADPRPVTRGSTPLPDTRNKAPRTSTKSSKGKASILPGGVLEENPLGCLCTYTKHERQEHKKCPVHSKVRVKA